MKSYLILIKKYLKNEISDEEKEVLKEWIEKSPKNKELFKKEVRLWDTLKRIEPIDTEIAYQNIVQSIHSNNKKVHLLGSRYKAIAYAAVMIGILLGVYYYQRLDDRFVTEKPELVKMDMDDVPSDKIKIIQADGNVVFMGFNDQKDIININGELIGRKKKNEFIVNGGDDGQLEFMEISIPKGKLFQLTLSDGTKVWLNAASTLRVPYTFLPSEKDRKVYLEGEAYFDVAANKEKPFIVYTSEIEVAVLGTQFNVSSYPEDHMVQTTLTEGLVVVNRQGDRTNKLKLEPNDQAVYTKVHKTLNKSKVDTKTYTSWMQGKIIIKDEPFRDLYKRIERTYDVEIISNHQKLNTTRFTGEFDIENVQEILNVFSETIDFTYEIEDKKITINP